MSSRSPSTLHPLSRLLYDLNGKAYVMLLRPNADPIDRDVCSVVEALRRRIENTSELITSKWWFLSPYTAFVHCSMYLLAGVLTGRAEHYDIAVRRHAAACLDMYWGIAEEINLRSQSTHPANYATVFNRDWWIGHMQRMSLLRVPCQDALDPRPAAQMLEHLPSLVCLSEPPDIPLLIIMLRKAWPNKTNLSQFVTKLKHVRASELKRRTSAHDEETSEADALPIKAGHQIMRYLMQWICLMHVGGYSHSQTLVTKWHVRALMTKYWNRIHDMTSDEIEIETDEYFQDPIMTIYAINEWMEYVLRSSPAAYDWLNQICGWQVYGDRLLEYCDAYRSLLPIPKPPDSEWLEKHAKTGDEWKDAEMEARLQMAVDECPLPVHWEQFNQRQLNVFLAETKANDRTQQPTEPRQHIPQPPKTNVINRADPFGKRAAESMSTRMCSVAMYGFNKRGFVIGSASRIPKSFWSFLWENVDLTRFIAPQTVGPNAVAVPTSLNAILSSPIQQVAFAPAATDVPHKRRAGSLVALEEVRQLTQNLLDYEWVFENGHLVKEFGDDAATRFIAPHLHHKFLSTSRIMAAVMLFYECHHDSVAIMATLVRMYYQRFKCGKPTITATFQRLLKRFPYEHAIIYGMLSGWREWSYLTIAYLPAPTTERQLYIANAVYGRRINGPPPESAHWLLFCPNCDRIYSLFTQFSAIGRYPTRYHSDQISGFQKPRVCTDTGALYCSRKTDRRAPICNAVKLIHCDIRGKYVYFNDKCYVRCHRAGCVNIMERSEYDVYTSHSYVCASCVLDARLATERAMRNSDKAEAKEQAKKARAAEAAARRSARPRIKAEETEAVSKQNAVGALPARLLNNPKYNQRFNVDGDAAAAAPLRNLAELARVQQATFKFVK